MKKFKIDKEKCIGCGLCASIAEKAFKISDEGKAEVIEPIKEDEAKIKEAQDACPVAAIEEVK